MRPLLAALVIVSLPALATEPAKKPAATTPPRSKAKVPSIALPSFGEIPKAEGTQGAQQRDLGEQTRTAAADATWEVVRLQHARQFAGGAGAATAIHPLSAVALKGNPPTTEKFTSLIRVKCAKRASAPIDVVILDQRGDTALSASGTLSFRGGNSDETEWMVDWEPTALRAAGDYQVLIRINGQPLGTWPLKIVQQ